MALFVRKDSEMEHKDTECDDALTNRKRKWGIKNDNNKISSRSICIIEDTESLLTNSVGSVGSNPVDFSPKKKRRKRDRKRKLVKIQKEPERMPLPRSAGLNNVKKKRNRKKKNQKVPVCS